MVQYFQSLLVVVEKELSLQLVVQMSLAIQKLFL
jgi:hypothetical protein